MSMLLNATPSVSSAPLPATGVRDSHPSAKSVPSAESSMRMLGSGAVAGPWMTSPETAEKIDPWHGQRNWSAGWKKLTIQPI